MEVHVILLASILALIASNYIFPRLIFKKKVQLPPGPKGLPLLGSLLTIGSKPHEFAAKLAKMYGPILTLKLGFQNIVVISSPEMSMQILQTHDLQLSGRPIPDAVTTDNGPFNLIIPWLPISPLWQKLRKISHAHVFSNQKLDSLQDLSDRTMEKMRRRIEEAGEGAVDITGIVFAGMSQMMLSSIFSSEEISSESIEQLKDLTTNIFLFWAKPNLSDYFPFLRPFDVQGIRRQVSKLYDQLHRLIDGMIDQRIETDDRRKDFFDTLLDYTKVEGDDGLTLQDVKLLIAIITATIEWVMAELIRNPTILFKVKQELKHKIELGKRVQELPYLTAVIKETMRLHPVLPMLVPHQAKQEVEIQGFTILKHTRIWINIWSISRDPTHWDEPTRFIPERFLTRDMSFQGTNFSFTPFGSGRRMCPGYNFATRMMSLTLATFLRDFDWKLPEGVTPDSMDMSDKLGSMLKKAQPLSLIPSKIIV